MFVEYCIDEINEMLFAAYAHGGYELEKIRAVDQFPHTGHIETVVALTLK